MIRHLPLHVVPCTCDSDHYHPLSSSRYTRCRQSRLNLPTAATELWLDLRGTKLSPTEAKDRLERDLGCTDFVDRIFIDATLSYTTDISKTGTTSMIVQQSYDQTNGRPILVGLDGIIVRLPASGILVDPMPALNAILDTTTTTTMYNNNTNNATTLLTKWIVLESEPGEPLPRQEGIASLVPLLAGAAATVGGGGDALLMGEDATTSTSTTRRGCGVAWSCQTRSDLLHAGMVVQSLERVESTRGGILLSSPLSFLTAAGSDDGKDSSTQLQCALLLPFDQVLWQTALKFFRESTDPEEGVADDEYDYFDDDIEDMLSVSRDTT
ncbi:hypothetical protein MHU86_16840 [Fragilaria crotonensis]|nr:hypothetical protein MHU86_16840 [Fragilaria crotonensis]